MLDKKEQSKLTDTFKNDLKEFGYEEN